MGVDSSLEGCWSRTNVVAARSRTMSGWSLLKKKRLCRLLEEEGLRQKFDESAERGEGHVQVEL